VTGSGVDACFTPVGEALERLEGAVSPLVGIVRQTMATMHAPDETGLANAACELAPAAGTIGSATVEYGSGAHSDGVRARAAAIGEALERYCGMFTPPGRLRVTSSRELGDEAVCPARFALFHPTQLSTPGFPFVGFTPGTRTAFVEGVSLADGSRAFLPAQLVFLGRLTPELRPIAYSTTSGLACGPSRSEATLAALFELVERDAVMLAWNARVSLPLLDWSGSVAQESVERHFFAPTGLRYSVLDGSLFLGIPVAIAVLHGPPGSRAALAIGAGCAATIEEAWLKALSESFGVYRWLCMEIASAPDRPPPRPEEVRTFDQHMLYFADEERAALASFLDASTERSRLDDVPSLPGSTPRAQVDSIVGTLARHGISAYATDVTTPDVRSLGLHVVRVLAPEACALDVWHAARFLGGPRLRSAAREAGLATAPLELDDVNPHPHPFP
jgi:ribosomal protein S12 methylthiotransferase accessory factor